MKNLGDKISKVATPIARALRMDCIDPVTRQLRPESRCAKTRNALNQGRYADAFYERFWPKGKEVKMNELIDYVVTKQIAVQAATPEEAVAKSATEGKTISLTANPKPKPQVPQAQRPMAQIPR